MSRPTAPLFKWFGSKWRSGAHYPPPEHPVIIEPFAGSAGYSLRYAYKDVILYESDVHIFRLWDWLINHATQQAIRDIPLGLTPGTDIRTLGLSLGQQLLLKSWQRTHSVGDCWTISVWDNKPGQWTLHTRDRVSEEFHAIRHWSLMGYDGYTPFDTLGDSQGITWFVDPPYQYNHQYRAKVSFQYPRLARCIQAAKGQRIVCEAVCPKTGAVPDWLPFREHVTVINSRRGYSKELIWTG